MLSGPSASRRLWRGLALACVGAFLFVVPLLSAQTPLPNAGTLPPAAAAQLLRSRPDLVAQLRQRLAQSSLTPDQIRARLRAQGYPEDLLDDYLAGADTARSATPTRGTLEALRALGVVDPAEADSLGQFVPDSLGRDPLKIGRDSLGRDTTRFVYDARGRARPKLQVFGLDVFRQRSTQFQPAASGPVDPSYRLGPGDVIVLILTGDVESATTLDVTREGFVVVPQVGQLYVANLTLEQLEDLLYARLGRVYSGVRRAGGTTRFQVSVARLRTVQVFVAGSVAKPGAYQIPGNGTVLSALYAAGGPTERGSFRAIEVRRGSTLLATIDAYDYLLRGINRADVRLQSGDVIFVQPRGALVAVDGAVLRPARYELRGGETLRDLITAAGGFDADALRTRVQIHRIVPPEARGGDARDRVVLDVRADAADAPPALPLAAGDSVVVFEVRDRVRRFVTVKGAVWLEGQVGLSDSMRLSDALRLAGGVRPEALLGSVLISRLQSDSSRTQLRSTLRDSTGALTADPTLREDDEITVFSRLRLATERFVSISGAVRKAGRIPYRQGMTLRDVVLLANGLTEDALLTEAEIARLPADRASGKLATTLRVPLDSTYVFERTPDGRYIGPPGPPTAASGAPEVPLEPYDNVLILRQPRWELLRQVTIVGQVRYPGTYSLQTRTDRLSDLIERAGGLTPEAYAAGVQFNRAQSRQGRIGIDLPRVLEDPSFRDNLLLAAGDSIVIPEYSPVVLVDGAVNSPVAVTHVPGKSVDFYVNAAGGFARLADKGRSYVQQPSGKIESGRGRRPLPGSRVYVPFRDPNETRTPTLQILSSLAGVLASLATIVIVARR
jgi:protein involved in polysaccharide export with SLBB domain